MDAKYGEKVQFGKYSPLLKDEQYPDQEYAERLDADSEKVFYGMCESYVAEGEDGQPYQLMRPGYYTKCNAAPQAVPSEIVTLKSNFNK